MPSAPVPDWVGSAGHQKLRDRVYESSITLVKNDIGLLPLHLKPHDRVLVVFPQRDTLTLLVEDRKYPSEFLPENIRQYHPDVSSISFPSHPTEREYAEVLQAAAQARAIIMVTVNAHMDPRQAELMQRLLGVNSHVIGIAVGNPYDLMAFPQLATYLTTYEYTQPVLATVVRIIFGQSEAQGHLPVSIPGLYPCGYSAPKSARFGATKPLSGIPHR